MAISILCDQTDCVNCKGGYTAHDYSYEYRCQNKGIIVICCTTGKCRSKEVKEEMDCSNCKHNISDSKRVRCVRPACASLREYEPRNSKPDVITSNDLLEIDEAMDERK